MKKNCVTTSLFFIFSIISIFTILLFFKTPKESMLISIIVSFIFSLIVFGFSFRILPSTRFIVNDYNKDDNRSIQWYKDVINSQIIDMRYEFVSENNGIKEYKAHMVFDLYEPPLFILETKDSICIKGSKLFIRIAQDSIDIDDKLTKIRLKKRLTT